MNATDEAAPRWDALARWLYEWHGQDGLPAYMGWELVPYSELARNMRKRWRREARELMGACVAARLLGHVRVTRHTVGRR